MSGPSLNLYAESLNSLITQLKKIDIKVPPITKGRTSQHREQYMMARFLSTAATLGKMSFPLSVEHRGRRGNPDFVLSAPGARVGVECVEMVPEEWYEIEAIREREFPEALNFGQTFRPGEPVFDRQKKRDVASGVFAGPPWVGKMAERQWVEAMEHFIGIKTEKLRAGNYSQFATVWLLIQDEWRVPLYDPEEVKAAAELCFSRISHLLSPPCFRSIFVCSRGLLLCYENGKLDVEVIRDLWRDASPSVAHLALFSD